MGQRGLNDEADAGARQHREQRREHRDRCQQHEHAIGGIGRVEQAKGDEIERGRHTIVHGQFAPDHLHHFHDHEGEAEGEQQFRDMAEPVHSPQSKALDERAQRADEQRGDEEPRPEPDMPGNFEAEISAEHIEAGMSEVQNAHHAEDQREAARHHEQQHAVQHAIQGREGYELEHFGSAPGNLQKQAPSSRAKRSDPDLGSPTRLSLDCFAVARNDGRAPAPSPHGRSILQVVGRTVSLALTTPTLFHPQPVPSSSNLAPGSSGPKLAIYMSWNSWWSSFRIQISPPSKASDFMPSNCAASALGSSVLAWSTALASMRISFTARG